jgi:hypothetical protein
LTKSASVQDWAVLGAVEGWAVEGWKVEDWAMEGWAVEG